MREIKFRAWYKHSYIELSDLRGNRSIYFSPYDLGLIAQGIDRKEVELEQYTGLKDKNGREIYEGDIVRIDSMDELRVGYVELVADQYCIVCGEEDGHKIVAEFYYYSKPEENCEVIGNIHENPEVLERKDAKN